MALLRVEVGNVQLAVEEEGNGPPILLLHAGIATRRMWDPQWTWLREGHRAVRYDLRGFGESRMAPGAVSYAGDALRVLDALGVERATVIGCSMGGSTALHLAITNPGRVAALALIGSGVHGYRDEEPEPPVFAEMEAAWQAEDYERVMDLEERAWVVGLARDRSAVDPAFLALWREMNRAKFQWEGVEVTYEDGRSDDAARLGEIAVPTLVVVGAEDVPAIVRQAHFIARGIREARLEVIPDAAHLPSVERTTAFDAILRPWLAAL